MAITSTTQMTGLRTPLIGARRVGTTSGFRGVINTVFKPALTAGFDQVGQSGLPPVNREFYNPAHPYFQIGRPPANAQSVTTYAFSPVIRLAFTGNSFNRFFDNSFANTSPNFSKNTFNTSSRHIGPKETFRELSRNLQNVDGLEQNRGRDFGSHQSMFVGGRKFTWFVVTDSQTNFQATSPIYGAKGSAAPVLLSNIFRFPTSIPSLAQFIKMQSGGGDYSTTPRVSFVDQRYLHSAFAVGRSAAAGTLFELIRSHGLNQFSQPTGLSATPGSVAGLNHATSAQTSLTTVALNFAAPRVAAAESVSERLAQFVSAPSMTYARPRQESQQGLIQALQDLRNLRLEPTSPSPPPWPSIDQLTNQVKTQLERELRIEKERRGL